VHFYHRHRQTMRNRCLPRARNFYRRRQSTSRDSRTELCFLPMPDHETAQYKKDKIEYKRKELHGQQKASRRSLTRLLDGLELHVTYAAHTVRACFPTSPEGVTSPHICQRWPSNLIVSKYGINRVWCFDVGKFGLGVSSRESPR
jgi:hypothetical protein